MGYGVIDMKERVGETMQKVEDRLIEWAEWASHGNWFGVGYSQCSVVYRLMTTGMLIKSTAPYIEPNNEEAEEMEALICELQNQNNDLANALRIHYLMSGSLRYKAKKFSISRDRLTYHLDMARQWLAGRLSAS
jgi:hypothetical protein